MVHRESRMRSLACKHDSVYDTLCACSNRSDALAFVIGKQTKELHRAWYVHVRTEYIIECIDERISDGQSDDECSRIRI